MAGTDHGIDKPRMVNNWMRKRENRHPRRRMRRRNQK